MNVLITGGCGFIGSNFINHLFSKNTTLQINNIINIDRLDYCAKEDNVNYPDNSRYTFIKGDVNDSKLISHILKTYNIEYVIHFAAQTHVDHSFTNSLQYTRDNILGTHNLLECCRIYNKILCFLHISTDEVYGEIELNHEGCTEKSLLNPTNPYAATKAGAEFLVKSYYYSFGMPIIIIRGNNVYGQNQYPEKLIPKFITLLKNNQKMTIQGTGNARRNFIHVNDVVEAIELIIIKGENNSIYNIGTTNEYSVLEIAAILLRIIKGDNAKLEDWVEYIPDRCFNDFRYSINSDSLQQLGWVEKILFLDGIQRTVAEYIE